MPHYFRCETYVTTLDIGLNVMPQRWPKVFLRQQLTSLFDIKMASQRIIVMVAD